MSVEAQPTGWVIEPRVNTFGFRLREVWRYRALLRFFALRAITKLYKRTKLGKAWIFIRPLFPLIVKTLIFGGLLGIQSEGVPYFLFLVVGTAIWDLFAGALMWATRSLELNRSLITRIYVPRLILPVAMMSPAFVIFALHVGVLVLTLGYYGVTRRVLYGAGFPEILWAGVSVVLVVTFALAIGLWTSVLGATARDVRFTLAYILDFWSFLTPVLYPLSAVPDKWRWLVYLNPLATLVEAFKWGVLGIGGVHYGALVLSCAIIATVLISGLWFFGRAEAGAVDRV